MEEPCSYRVFQPSVEGLFPNSDVSKFDATVLALHNLERLEVVLETFPVLEGKHGAAFMARGDEWSSNFEKLSGWRISTRTRKGG